MLLFSIKKSFCFLIPRSYFGAWCFGFASVCDIQVGARCPETPNIVNVSLLNTISDTKYARRLPWRNTSVKISSQFGDKANHSGHRDRMYGHLGFL